MEELFDASRCPLWKIEKENYIWLEYISQVNCYNK